MSIKPYMFEKLHPFHSSGMDKWLSECPAFRTSSGHPIENLTEFTGREQEAKIDKDGFQVCIDVQHFQPNEISVKTENKTVVVQAKHEEKKDEQGFISREFTRRYTLPDGINVENITSNLSSDGILSIKAPQATPAVEGNVRYIQIQQTGPAQKEEKEEKEGEK